MEGQVSRVKQARLLSQNQIRDIVMDSDSDEQEYYASADMEDEEQPCPPLQRSPISQPPSPDYSAGNPKDEDDVGNVAGQQPQPSQCLLPLPPKPQRHVVHTFIGVPNGKSSEAVHVTSESTPLSVLLLFFAEIITLLVVEMNW
jgi:hypothetical protein